MAFLAISRRSDWTYAASGDTWGLNDIYKAVPGLGWDSSRHCVYGRGDAVSIYISKARARGYTIAGDVPILGTTEPLTVEGMHPLQKAGAGWLARQGFDGAILADPMGGGKTWQSLSAATTAVPGGRKLVVCPAFLRTNWITEIEKRLPGSETSIRLSKQAKKDSTNYATKSGWHVISYEGLKLVAAEKWDAVIFDEAHYLKTPRSGRSTEARELARRVPWRAALTATAVWNRRRDLWGVAEVVRGGGLGRFWDFATCYLLAKQGTYGWDLDGPYPEDEAYEEVTGELRERLGWFYLRRDSITRDLVGGKPRRIVTWVEAPKKYTLPIMDGDGLECRAAIEAGLRETAGAKLDAAEALAREATEDGQKFICWTYTKAHARELAQRLGVPCITGDLAADDRLRIVRDAGVGGAGGANGIVATMDSLGMGANIQWASISIFADLDWVPPKLLQCEGRTYRPGQDKQVVYYYLACRGTLDEMVVHAVVEKLNQITGLFDDRPAEELKDSLIPDAASIMDGLIAKLSGAGPEEILEDEDS